MGLGNGGPHADRGLAVSLAEQLAPRRQVPPLKSLQRETRQLEEEISRIHDEITKHMAELDDTRKSAALRARRLRRDAVNGDFTVPSRSLGQSRADSDQHFQLPRQDSNLEPAG